MLAHDHAETRKLVPVVAEFDGPVYLRLSRAEVPIVFDEDCEVEIGSRSVHRSGTDITLVATGVMVDRSLLAADELGNAGAQARSYRWTPSSRWTKS